MYRILSLFFIFFLAKVNAQEATFPIKLNQKWGLINASGNIVVEPLYDAIGEFKTYGYAVMQRGGKVGMINRSGRELVAPKYDDLRLLDSTLIAIKVEKGWSIIDLNGQVILDRAYDRVKAWHGKYLAFMVNRKWGIVHIDGTPIAPPTYDKISFLPKGYFETSIAGKKGLLDATGKEIIPVEVQKIVVEGDDFFLFQKDKLWGARNRNSTLLLNAEFNNLQRLNDNFIKLIKKSKVSLFSISAGKIITEDHFDDFYAFNATQILVKKERKMGLIDEFGVAILPIEYNEILPFGKNLFRVNYRYKWGVVDNNNEEVIPLEYSYIAPPKGMVCQVRKGAFSGVVNLKGDVLVDPKFHTIELTAEQAKAHLGEALSVFNFDAQGNLQDENNFNKHFTITIGGSRNNRDFSNLDLEDNDSYLLDKFEWYYSSAEDRWGLRRRDDGAIQIKPTFDWISIEREHGFTIVGIEKTNYYDFEWTKFSFGMIYGLVNNDVGLLVTKMDLLDIRLTDFDNKYPVARCIFSSGLHGLITRKGVVVQRDYTYIGDFHDGMARMSAKGRLSGSFKSKKQGLGDLSEYLNKMWSPNYMIDYTLYDQEFENDAVLNCQGCEWGFFNSSGQVAIANNYDFVKDYKNEVALVKSKGKWGMINLEDEALLPCQYDELKFLENTNGRIVQLSSNRQKYGLIDTLGHVRVDLAYDEIGAFKEGRLAVKRNGLWGFVDPDGIEVIPCKFRRVNYFNEGLATVKLKEKWGVIDSDGTVVVDFRFPALGNFSEGLSPAREKYRSGFINPTGKFVIDPKYDKAFAFEGGVARVVDNGKYGLIDQSGRYILKPQYSRIDAFNEYGTAVVQFGKNNIRYGLIDRSGKMTSVRAFRQIGPFSEGRAAVKYKDKYGFIDPLGKMVIDNDYSKVGPFVEGKAMVQRNGLCGYINKEGEEIIDLEYSRCLDFEDGKAVVYKGYRQGGIIDAFGNQILEPSVNRLYGFKDGRGLVRDEKYRFYYITDEARLFEGYYEKASEFQHGIAVVQSEGKWGVINQKGLPLIPPKYDRIDEFEDGFAKVRIKRVSGLSDLNGKILINPDFEYISYAGEGLFRLEKGDRLGYFDANGQWVWDLNN